MLLWRLSGERHAQALDGGYGLHFDGRWNTIGHAVTYCATSPALCVLEKLVHVEDPTLLPELTMVTYSVPDDLDVLAIELGDLPQDWRRQEGWTQQRGDEWHSSNIAPFLRVPSAIVPIDGSPDINVLINSSHPASAAITIQALEPFVLDPRLF
ncbi:MULTISPECIES: RES family NAD+ phosphorylase [unclassified Aurantimonas]|uniref:RES family NAD+ phosphorylase n=1 Tax=unclassified Aurantimonas TaxID=2638230 RepID=UPI002E17DB5D|nr:MULTISPECIES: RES family NAD+ phosphorylase [unclassified Aurantimonas]MEC5291917.1 RES family NAD+ phosphorylase [Aurantimonas sp. C2-3-R2]MEC5413003.1 RES family NAD+ phosphorylase [Aurantimonas sp. C2-4-R8]